MIMTKDEAIDQVEKSNKAFYIEALRFAESWIKSVNMFTSEDMIADFNEQAREPRVWGAVMRQLSRENLITHYNWTTYKGVQGHGKPVRIWKVN